MRGECSSCLRPCGYSCDAGSYKRCAEQALVFLIKLVRSVNRLRPYVGASILYSGRCQRGVYRFVGVVEYGDHLHVIAATLSARGHAISPSLAKQYMSSLETFTSRLVAGEYSYVNVDAYTYAVVAHRFTKSVRGNISTNKNYSIARLYVPYKLLKLLLPKVLCNLYTARCKYDGHRARHSMCMLAHLFCGWTE